jgi:tRNA G10  N-methylase Trm11
MPDDVLKRALLDCFEHSIDQAQFSSSLFFKGWYPTTGSGYYFLFKKSLRATNIQFPEVLALLRNHILATDGKPVSQLQFVSTARFRDWIEALVSTLNPQLSRQGFQTIAELYAPIFYRTIVVDPFYTSCSVFLPAHLSIELLPICAYSGYIHSCGRNVFIRKVDKTLPENLFTSVDEFLKRYAVEGRKIFFAVYAHEDFTDYDRDIAGDLRYGLDDVKIYIEKFYMGPTRLVTVLEKMRTRYANQLEIPDPGDFREMHTKFRQHPDVDTSRTLWLIQDHGIGPNRSLSTERFFICYDQSLINENPFHIFDENKPAWVSHTTIPHTLMGAMINITRPGWPDADTVKLGDPFVGTGTTWLETRKYNAVTPLCSDLAPSSTMLCRDNLDFFCFSTDELMEINRDLKRLIESLDDWERNEESPSLFPLFDRIRDAYERASKAAAMMGGSNEIDLCRELDLRSFSERLLFYLALRTLLRNIAAFERNARDWQTAYIEEVTVLRTQIESLIHLRERQELVRSFHGDDKLKNIAVFQGRYSIACSISTEALRRERDKKNLSQTNAERDVRDIPPLSYQVILADPPYGFNTDDEALTLGETWTSALWAMIQALENDGQLVICLPDLSHTGRSVQFFTHRQFITQQILAIAEELGREVIVPADVLPTPSEIFRPPYYWEAERALRRAIVHFRIRFKRPLNSDYGWVLDDLIR